MATTRIVTVSGSLWSPSKTSILARSIGQRLALSTGGELEVIDVATFSAELGAALRLADASVRVRHATAAIAAADVLVAASPVFRGSFGGHFKHLFDLIELDALRGKPVVLAATGGGDKHCLVVEHALRPLFSFLGGFTAPTAIYATERDFLGDELTNPAVLERVDTAVREALAIHRAGIGAQAQASRVERVATTSSN
jgi:FMN reductase